MVAGEVWWITGASSGIGEAIAQAAAGQGARLILSGRNQAELDRVANLCGGFDKCLILPFEATEFAAIPALVDKACEWAGRIDCLVNNAGISQRSLAVETEFSVYQRIIDVDLMAPIALTQAVLPHMIAAGGGRLIAISSVAGVAGVPLRSAYCAAKHGVIGYFDSVRAETAHLGISVHVIAPGSIKTNVSRNALTADGSVRGESDAAIENGIAAGEAAAMIMDAVAQGQRELVIAQGAEARLAQGRGVERDPVFDTMAGLMQAGYAQQMAATKATN
ncbi:MAG: SDR family NAD(P)-dependent oxidoreductase [Sphingomonadaceae bacterium]